MNSQKKLRIAWLHTHFLYSTGATRYVFEVAKRLSQEHEITIFVEQTSNLWKKNFTREGIKICELLPFSSNNPIYWLFFPFFLRHEVRALKKRLAAFGLIISSMFPMNWVAGQLEKPHIQLCVEPFAFFYDSEFVASFPFPKRFFIKILSNLYRKYDLEGVSRSARLLTLNKAVAARVKEIYKRDPTGLTHIGVDVDLFKPTVNEHLKKKYAKNKTILHSTDFTALKGTNFIIEALPEIVKKIKNTKLVITQTVENPSMKEKFLQRAKELGVKNNIEFVGFVRYGLLPAYYTLADVVAFTGHPESKGASQASLTVLEALACQTPVVRSIGCEEEVIDGKSGYLVDPRNTKALSQALIKILTNPKLAERMGGAGRKWVVERYTWDKVSEVFRKHIEVLTKPEQKGFSLIKHEGKTLGMVFRNYLPVKGIQFFTDDMNPFQVGIHEREKGIKLTPHIHRLSHSLTIDEIQEILFVQSGKAKVTFYTKKGEKVKAVILEGRDTVLLMSEGHGVDFLEDTRIFEIKQGPYPGTEHAKLYLKEKK